MERLSIFDIYKIGVGPSSSHTLGPWKAANRFAKSLQGQQLQSVKIQLFGSLAKTGVGHGTDIAVMLGLEGHDPERIPTEKIGEYIERIKKRCQLEVNAQAIPFDPGRDIIFQNYSLPFHPNTLKFEVRTIEGQSLEKTFYSIGGGFILEEGESEAEQQSITLPYPIDQGKELCWPIRTRKAARFRKLFFKMNSVLIPRSGSNNASRIFGRLCWSVCTKVVIPRAFYRVAYK